MQNRTSGSKWTCAILFAALGLLYGCNEGLKVSVLTNPGDATGTITEIKSGGETGRQYRFSGNTDKLSLSRTKETVAYLFKAERNNFQPLIKELSLRELENLPAVKGVHEVRLALTNEYVIQQQLIIVYDPDLHAFVGKKRNVRAWWETTGDDSGIVSRVFDRIDKESGIRGMAISPDGSQLVFAEAIPLEDSPEAVAPQLNNIVKLQSCNIKSIKIDFSDTTGDPRAGGIEHIRQGNYRDLDPTFTSDGENLLFASNRRRPNSADLLQVALGQVGGILDIYRVPDEGIALSPSMGYNGLISFGIYNPTTGINQIWTYGGGRFPTELKNGSQPRISPDGTKIAYIGEDRNLWMIDSDGTSPTQLTTRSEEVLEAYCDQLTDEELEDFDPELFAPYSFPTWTPDGTRIVYTSMEGIDSTDRPNDDIWIINEDGTDARSLTSNGSIDSNPVVSPNGKWVFFVSNRGGDWAIWALGM